jgi:hypothetical protein
VQINPTPQPYKRMASLARLKDGCPCEQGLPILGDIPSQLRPGLIKSKAIGIGLMRRFDEKGNSVDVHNFAVTNRTSIGASSGL